MMRRACRRCCVPRPQFRLFTSSNNILDLKRKQNWKYLTENQRFALEQLGWNSALWDQDDSRNAPSSLKTEFKLLDVGQQAAISHGLQMTEEEWDRSVTKCSQLAEGQHASTIPTLRSESTKNSKGIGGMLWSGFKVVAPIVAGALGGAASKKHPMLGLAAKALEHFPSVLDAMSNTIVVNDVETILYLDDSASMKGTNLSKGHQILASMSNILTSNIRVVKFGSRKTIIAARDEELSLSLAHFGWDASSGSTYMWKMIEDDVIGKYAPGNGKLRIVIITDGEDCLSPGEYRGMRGMDPMMRVLLGKGFDIEWHIVMLGRIDDGFGSLSRRDANRYKSLAAATGGSFLVEDGSILNLVFNENKKEAADFLDTLKESGESGDAARRARRQKDYLLEANAGKREKFDWLTLLPPPSGLDSK